MDRTKLMGIALLGVAVLVAGWTAWRAPVVQKAMEDNSAASPMPDRFEVHLIPRDDSQPVTRMLAQAVDRSTEGWTVVQHYAVMHFSKDEYDLEVKPLSEPTFRDPGTSTMTLAQYWAIP